LGGLLAPIIMKYTFEKGAHSVYTLNYHRIICVKYRRDVFVNDEIVDRLKEQIKRIAPLYDVSILNQETDEDHVHILFSATPKTDLVKFINALKGATARKIRKDFPEVKKKLWKDVFWSPSYCLITTGQVTLDQLKKYVESQGEKRNANNL
jgi:putative transposase